MLNTQSYNNAYYKYITIASVDMPTIKTTSLLSVQIPLAEREKCSIHNVVHNDTNVFHIYCPDGVHPSSDSSKHALEIYAGIVTEFIKQHR